MKEQYLLIFKEKEIRAMIQSRGGEGPPAMAMDGELPLYVQNERNWFFSLYYLSQWNLAKSKEFASAIATNQYLYDIATGNRLLMGKRLPSANDFVIFLAIFNMIIGKYAIAYELLNPVVPVFARTYRFGSFIYPLAVMLAGEFKAHVDGHDKTNDYNRITGSHYIDLDFDDGEDPRPEFSKAILKRDLGVAKEKLDQYKKKLEKMKLELVFSVDSYSIVFYFVMHDQLVKAGGLDDEYFFLYPRKGA